MNLIFTIVRKDARRLRWQLALLGLVMVMKFGVGWWLALGRGSGELSWEVGSQIGLGLVLVEGGLAYLIAGALVLGDAVTGAQEFWQTRPISGRRLLAAKLVGAFVFLGVPPLVLGLPWWMLNGFGAGEMVRATALAWAWRVVLVAAAFFNASLADKTSRFVMWSVVGVAALGSQTVVWSLVLPSGRNLESVGVGIVLAGLIVAVAVAVVPGRFRSGIAAGWRVLAAAAIFLAAIGGGLGVAMPTGPFGNFAWNEARPDAARDVRLTWRGAQKFESRRPDGKMEMESRFSIAGVPEGMEVESGFNGSEWAWPDGRRMDGGFGGSTLNGGHLSMRDFLRVGPPQLDDETERWWKAGEKDREEKARQRGHNPAGWGAQDATGLEGVTFDRVVPAVAELIERTQPAFELKANLRFYRARQWAEIPLRPGGWQAGFEHGVRVRRVQTEPSEAVVRIVETGPTWSKPFLAELNRSRHKRPQFLAVNRETGWLAGLSDRGDRGEVARVWIGGVELRATTLTLTAPWVMRAGQRVVTEPNWLEKTQLAWVGWEEVARINRTVRTEKYVVGP